MVFDLPSDMESRGYSRISRQVLDAGKVEKLGWGMQNNESNGIENTVRILRECGHE